MCLHSRMGNNNWLKQSLLWENKRPGSVASEGQAWWHSKHLNSHWLLGRWRSLSTSRSSPGGDRFTQSLGLGVRMLFLPHLPLLGLQSHLFPLYCHTLWLLCSVLAAWNQRENAVLCCQRLYVPPPLNNCAVPDSLHMSWCVACMQGNHAHPCHAWESCSTAAQSL